jgi:hypothetical protein
MNAGYGLSVRWSLEAAPVGVAQELRDYVVGTSMAKFMFLDGLGFKTWRMVEGQWFEGTYVFDEKVYRDDFQREFTATAAEAAGSAIIGSSPTLLEPFEVVAIAEGPGRFRRGPGPGPDTT